MATSSYAVPPGLFFFVAISTYFLLFGHDNLDAGAAHLMKSAADGLTSVASWEPLAAGRRLRGGLRLEALASRGLQGEAAEESPATPTGLPKPLKDALDILVPTTPPELTLPPVPDAPTLPPLTMPPLPTLPSAEDIPKVTIPPVPTLPGAEEVHAPTVPPKVEETVTKPPEAAGAEVTFPPVPKVTIAPVNFPSVAPALTTSGSSTAREGDGTLTGAKKDDDFLTQFEKAYDKQAHDWKTWVGHIAYALITGALYYCLITSNYPELDKSNNESREIQQKPCCEAICEVSPPICCHSFFCSQARAATTFSKVLDQNYWLCLILMALFPFCTVCYANACTDLNVRLGGKKQNVIMSCLCTWFCMCCVIGIDAQSLDAATGATTQCCGVQDPEEGSQADSESDE